MQKKKKIKYKVFWMNTKPYKNNLHFFVVTKIYFDDQPDLVNSYPKYFLTYCITSSVYQCNI